ncbi:MAG: DUF1127 domain-containing protein [Pelagimonas sp.]|jgi:uncharacterized protein YjiS (DUF1127 family)|nr:DUF1127 domain-containing protein [Pelagimonas sp.]
MAHTNARTALELDFAAMISHAVADVQNIFARNAMYRKTVRELSALDARQLDDLGITAADITRIARRESHNI